MEHNNNVIIGSHTPTTLPGWPAVETTPPGGAGLNRTLQSSRTGLTGPRTGHTSWPVAVTHMWSRAHTVSHSIQRELISWLIALHQSLHCL